jgi:putative FmdB family regulatory protein
MPLYDFKCPECDSVIEQHLRVDDRNKPIECPHCGCVMQRMITTGMAVVWQGRFHDRWAQKQDMDGLGSSW